MCVICGRPLAAPHKAVRVFRMKNLSRFAFALLIATALSAQPARARADDAIGKPVSAWLVGPSQASQFDTAENPGGLGCLMVSEFDNGFIIGLHARAAGIVGMTIDTRKPTMEQGSKKPVGLNLGPDAYVLDAVASDPSTLSLDLREAAGGGRKIAERLTGLGSFRLLVNEHPYYFATTGFTDGLARLQTCMGGMMAVTVPVEGAGAPAGVTRPPLLETKAVTSSGNDTPLALAMPELIPAGYRFVLNDVDPMTPVNWQAGQDWTEVMRGALSPHGLKMTVQGDKIIISKRAGSEPVLDGDPAFENMKTREIAEVQAVPPVLDDDSKTNVLKNVVGVWGGAKGESLASVLDAWGLMAGVKVKLDIVGDLNLPADVRYEGSFDDAVQKLLGLFSGRNRPVGTFEGGSVASAMAAPAPVAIKQDTPPKTAWKPRPAAELAKMAQDAQGKKNNRSWQALEGTALRDTLEHWGAESGVKLVWMTDQPFPLPQTVRTFGSFEDALRAALALYGTHAVRPQAQLNTDPQTGERVLVVKTDKP